MVLLSAVLLLRLPGLAVSPAAGLLVCPPPAALVLCERRSCRVRRSLREKRWSHFWHAKGFSCVSGEISLWALWRDSETHEFFHGAVRRQHLSDVEMLRHRDLPADVLIAQRAFGIVRIGNA